MTMSVTNEMALAVRVSDNWSKPTTAVYKHSTQKSSTVTQKVNHTFLKGLLSLFSRAFTYHIMNAPISEVNAFPDFLSTCMIPQLSVCMFTCQ